MGGHPPAELGLSSPPWKQQRPCFSPQPPHQQLPTYPALGFRPDKPIAEWLP